MNRERQPPGGFVEDLSVLARRGALPGAAEGAFADALSSSATLSTAHRVGLDFDQIVAVRAGDDALIAAMATRALSRTAVKSTRRWGSRALLLAAALALASSAAAWWRLTPSAPTPAPTPAETGRAVALRSALPAPPTVPIPSASNDAAVPPSPSPEVGSAAGSSRAPTTRAAGPESKAGVLDSADALFREANAARRAGDNAMARALYLRLQLDFPASSEAQLAHVSLGNLLLRMGRAAEAEQQFSGYSGARGALAQEALVGRARSLGALGRDADERRVWLELLSSYPDSVYAGQARKRLATLEHTEPSRP
ncbi:MAG TPA: tetratricopeptide repeat protein [Polyangiaceae bacterium]|nr:tetratricopeptide repeat protein [Polyangiaceae bacterium]